MMSRRISRSGAFQSRVPNVQDRKPGRTVNVRKMQDARRALPSFCERGRVVSTATYTVNNN